MLVTEVHEALLIEAAINKPNLARERWRKAVAEILRKKSFIFLYTTEQRARLRKGKISLHLTYNNIYHNPVQDLLYCNKISFALSSNSSWRDWPNSRCDNIKDKYKIKIKYESD